MSEALNQSPLKKGEDGEAEWVSVQKKTFTKWMNLHLKKVGTDIGDCKTEFKDGIKLMLLLKSLYGLELPKYNKNPKLRANLLDNVTLALQMIEQAQIKTNFLKTTHLVDCDLKMILGMIWAIILDFQIKGISVEELSAREALLLWCQRKTKDYKDVKVDNFSGSWRDGMALCALIHKHRPDLIDFDSLDKASRQQNLLYAFDVAQQYLGIEPLLDAEDIANSEKPDERSVMTYISEFYHKFTKQNQNEVAARRIQKFVRFNQSMDDMEAQYTNKAREISTWIKERIQAMADRSFDDDLETARKLILVHKEYKVSEKRHWNEEKLDNESLCNTIQAKLRVNKRQSWTAPEGLSVEAIETLWDKLGVAEKDRGKALRDNLSRLKDLLKKEFAEKAENFSQWVLSMQAELFQETEESQEKQLEKVNQMSSDIEQSTHISDLADCYKKLEQAGIEDDNQYTDFTFEELNLMWDQLKNAVRKKKHMLENQTVATGKNDISPEQIADFKETFRHFDKDQSGVLDKLEFRACLQSLDYTFSDDDFNAIHKQLNNNDNHISFERFLDFMIRLIGDTDDADQIKTSFRMLSANKDTIAAHQLNVAPMENLDVQYLVQNMPPKDSNYDYAKYTDSCFASP